MNMYEKFFVFANNFDIQEFCIFKNIWFEIIFTCDQFNILYASNNQFEFLLKIELNFRDIFFFFSKL